MRHSYHDKNHRVSVDLLDISHHEWVGEGSSALPDWPTKTYLVTRVEVGFESRGMGHGRRVIQTMLDDADAEDAWLVLTCDPDGSAGALHFDALWSWYERLGFERLHDDMPDMYRKPKRPNP